MERETEPADKPSSVRSKPWRPFLWVPRFREPRATYPGVERGGPPHPPLCGLAPGGVCRAPFVTEGAVRSYRTVSPLPRDASAPIGGLFSVALSVGSLPLAVSQHPALRSSDFPRRVAPPRSPVRLRSRSSPYCTLESSARFASASARALNSRRTCAMRNEANLRASALARSNSGLRPSFRTL